MKYSLTLLSANLVSLSLAIAAGILAFYDKPSWGWFLFGSIVLYKSIQIDD